MSDHNPSVLISLEGSHPARAPPVSITRSLYKEIFKTVEGIPWHFRWDEVDILRRDGGTQTAMEFKAAVDADLLAMQYDYAPEEGMHTPEVVMSDGDGDNDEGIEEPLQVFGCTPPPVLKEEVAAVAEDVKPLPLSLFPVAAVAEDVDVKPLLLLPPLPEEAKLSLSPFWEQCGSSLNYADADFDLDWAMPEEKVMATTTVSPFLVIPPGEGVPPPALPPHDMFLALSDDQFLSPPHDIFLASSDDQFPPPPHDIFLASSNDQFLPPPHDMFLPPSDDQFPPPPLPLSLPAAASPRSRGERRGKFRLSLFECPSCKKVFNSMSMLRRHSSVHDGGRHVCKQCAAAFHNRTSLTKHQMEMHAIPAPTSRLRRDPDLDP